MSYSRFCEGGPMHYDKESAEGSNWVSQGGESESGQMVLKKVKWTYFDAYLCQTMWNNAKKSMKRLKRPNSLFLQGEVSSAVLKTWKTRETKTRITQNFQILNHIQGTTIGKLTSWGFRKCGSFCSGEFLKRRYWLSKSSNFSIFLKSKMRCSKKKTRPQFWFFRLATESAWTPTCGCHADSVATLKNQNCGRVFFF